jgi:hypothetical protein
MGNVMESANDLANLSSIEILWHLGKNCMAIGTHHIIACYYTVISPEDLANLSFIQILWRFGKNCLVVMANHRASLSIEAHTSVRACVSKHMIR